MQAIRRKLYKLRSKKAAAKASEKEFATAATKDMEEKLRKSGVDEETIKRLRGK